MARSTNPLGLTDYQWQLLRWSADHRSHSYREYGQLFTTGGNPATHKALASRGLIEKDLYVRDQAKRQALEGLIRENLRKAAEELSSGNWQDALAHLQYVKADDYELRRTTLWLTPKALALVEAHRAQ